MNSGSTAVALSQTLQGNFSHLTVITHSLDVFTMLNNSFSVILCGGFYLSDEQAFYGVPALALFLLSGQNAAFSVLFSALLAGCMHGVNVVLICMIPPFFESRGNVSTVSGVLNSCTYVGSALSTYGIAVLSETVGWSWTLLIWLGIAALGGVVCLLSVKP